MSKRFEMFNSFVVSFYRHAMYVREVLLVQVLLMALGGVAISRIEGISLGESTYFAFITGLTIGYGDVTPTTTTGRILSVGIGLIGMLFTGIVVAIATRSLRVVAEQQKQAGQP